MNAISPDQLAADDAMASIAPVQGGWYGCQLADQNQDWRISIPESVTDELIRLADELGVRQPLNIHAPRPQVKSLTSEFAFDVRRRLSDGLGFAVLTDFPVDSVDERRLELVYWMLGLLLGRPVSQSRKGDLLGRVENVGADISSPVQRGYESSAALPFHVDRTDVIGLLCVRPAEKGGVSRLASSKTAHDVLLAEQPELLRELYGLIPHDRRGEEQPGELSWLRIPVFSRVDGAFATRYVRRFIVGSQRHKDAPRLTEAQLAAMDALDEVLERPGLSLDMELQRGDLQLINNFHILHARSAFVSGDGPGRLLLRLWLSTPDSPALPPEFAPLYGACEAGTYRGGVWGTGAMPSILGQRVDEIR